MPLSASRIETEIKLALPDAAAGRRLLRRAGFRLHRRRVLESNLLYDFPDGRLRAARCLLRIRRSGTRSLLTYKGPGVTTRHKSRREWEVEISDGGALGSILAEVGLVAAYRYEKYRAEYRRHREPGVAALDETPAGVFLELEGPPAWIDRSARRLGFSPGDYITATYATLWNDYCRRKGLADVPMVFGRHDRGTRSSTQEKDT